MKRPVIFISDSTGITTETLGHSLLTQFPSIEFATRTLRFIDTANKAQQVCQQVNTLRQRTGQRPIVFSTMIDPELRDTIAASDCLFVDFMAAFVHPLEQELGVRTTPAIGHSHHAADDSSYKHRIDALNFALNSDDGLGVQHYDQADVILAGVSRSGKTPTCLYLALHYGIFAANYPLVEQDLEALRLPKALRGYQQRVFGLSINAERLHQIRQERRPDSRYASRAECEYEVRQINALFRQTDITSVDVTHMSIEEIAAVIMEKTGMDKNILA